MPTHILGLEVTADDQCCKRAKSQFQRPAQRTNVPRWAARSAHSGACIQTENGPSSVRFPARIGDHFPPHSQRSSPVSSSGDFERWETRAIRDIPSVFVLRLAGGCLDCGGWPALGRL